MKQRMSSALVTAMGISLLLYTSLRTLNFVRLTLPRDSQDTAYLALVAFDGGLLFWLMFYMYGARGSWQRGISMLMVVVDLVGVLIGFGADTMWTAAGYGLAQMSRESAQTAIMAMAAIIGANVAAVVATHLTHPDQLRAAAIEEANARIVDAEISQINQNSVQVAAEVAPQLAANWSDRTRRQHLDAIEVKPAPAQLAPERLNAQVEPETAPAGVTVKRSGVRPNP